MNIAERMKQTFETIEKQIMAGDEVNRTDRAFYSSYLASIKGTNAGNAGKRKQTRTGK